MGLNWDDLRYFLALHRKKSLNGAAAELNVTHTTVSRRITALEATLETRLFLRTEKGSHLTPAGEKLLPFAEQLENTTMNLEESVAGCNNLISGAIRIGAPDGLGNCYLAARLGKLQSRHSSLAVELVPIPAYYSLSKREIDILITVRKPLRGNVVVRRLARYRLGLFASRAYLESAPPARCKQDLKHHTFVGYIDDLLFDNELNFMDEILPGLNVAFRSSTVMAQLAAVASGAGIGVIPFFMSADRDDLIPVLSEICIERSYWLQVNPDSRQLARVRTAMDFLVAQVAADKALFMNAP
ncbi:MAG: LysR family transcriptional regulator [Desulfobacter sp.]|nr:MAG: LysR family transcriptional regulator [Desulfobacter sp.]